MSDHPHDLSPSLGSHEPIVGDAPRLGGDAALTHLVSALSDRDMEVKQRAIEAIEAVGGERALIMLLQAAEDRDFPVRRRAIIALTRFRGEQVHAVMRRALTDVADSTIRQHAVAWLGEVHDPADVEALLTALTADNQRTVRRAAARALAEIGDPRAIQQMIQAAVGNPLSYSPDYHRDFMEAFRRFYAQQPNAVAQAMVDNLLDADQHYYAPILQYFDKLKPREALPTLIDVVRSEASSVFQKRNAIWALGYLRDATAVPVLVEIGHDEREAKDVRTQAIRNLGKIRDDSVYPSLLAFLEAGGPLAEAAWKGLSYLPIQSVLPELFALSHHEDWKTRRRVLNILRAKRGADAVPVIIERLGDVRQEVRLIAVKALERSRHADAAPALLNTLIHDRADSIRAAAAHALRFHAYPPALPVLAELLSDPKDTVRFHAALTLSNLYAAKRTLFDGALMEQIRKHSAGTDFGYALRRILDNRQGVRGANDPTER